MTRAGFEADRLDIVTRDLGYSVERRFVVRVGEGVENDRSVSEMAWTPDSRELLLTADHLGQHPVLRFDPATAKTRVLVPEGTAGSPQVVAGERILFSLHTLLHPTELFTVAADGSDARRVTRMND